MFPSPLEHFRFPMRKCFLVFSDGKVCLRRDSQPASTPISAISLRWAPHLQNAMSHVANTLARVFLCLTSDTLQNLCLARGQGLAGSRDQVEKLALAAGNRPKARPFSFSHPTAVPGIYFFLERNLSHPNV